MYRDIIKFETEPGKRIDITRNIKDIIKKSKIHEGVCNIFFPGTTGGIISNENDLMLMKDFERFFESIAQENKIYQHAENAHSHIRGTMTKCDITVPISNNSPILGEWQSIIFWEFDTRNRSRSIIVTIIGK